MGDTLIIQGIQYVHSTINKLPPNLTLGKAYLKETEDSGYFQTEHSWPSSFAPADIVYLGTPYSSLEQGYSHHMAVNSGDKEKAHMILQENNPRKCKELTKCMKNLA